KPNEGEKINGPALLKFLYGHIVEELVFPLLEKAGFNVQKRQQTVGIQVRDGTIVEGHIDAIVDGTITDIKSANSRGFDKFKYHKLEYNDPFGYLDQLDF